MRPDQGQQGGDNSQQYQAGRDNQITVNHYHYYNYEVSERRLQELAQRQEKEAIELWEQNAPRLVQQAKDEFANRAIEMTREVIKNVIADDPENLELLGQARAQIPLLKAQNSFGETGNKESVPHLAGLVAQLIASEPQSYIEMISRRCVDCITNMTSEHLNLVTTIAMLQRRWFPTAASVEMLIENWRRVLSPYFGRIPTQFVEYDYINSLGVGERGRNDLNRFASVLTGVTDDYGPYSRLRATHPNAMYDGFRLDELPEKAKALNPADYFLSAAESPEVMYLKPEFANKWLSVRTSFSNPERPTDPAELALVQFCESRMLSTEEFKRRVRGLDPELADFLDILEVNNALDLIINPVGLMLAAQEETIRGNGEKSSFLDMLQPTRDTAIPNPAAG